MRDGLDRLIYPALSLSVFGALTLLFFWQLAFTDLILARGDTFAYFYPYWDARDSALIQGVLPLWSPELFMGVPLLANSQLGTLYPPNWLTIPLDAPDSVRISILLHVAWAGLGTFVLARRVLALPFIPALIAGGIFAFGGHIGAHVEQINQLHGLSWMPWLFYFYDRTRGESRRWLAFFGMAWALQLLSGHTQTTFITGVGLGIYALACGDLRTPDLRALIASRARNLIPMVIAALLALVLALPQLVPTQELISVSNRGGGLTAQQATAFSLNPYLIGRGLLPSYAGQPFGEYVAYTGVIGLALAVIGTASADKRRWPWVVLVIVGLIFALGRHTPLYLVLANLPGFNLFRVPARWLALFALGGALLAGLGARTLLERRAWPDARVLAGILALAGGLAALSLLSGRAADEVDGPAVPTMITFAGWGVALIGFLLFFWFYVRGKSSRKAGAGLLCVLVLAELWLAAGEMPFNDVTDPAVYRDGRFAVHQMRVYGEESTPPDRMLSISNLLFDPGDRAGLEARWQRMGLGDRAARYAFTSTKMSETLAGNLPLTWGIPTIDGFDGGVLPTMYYTAFTSLLLPEGTLRTIDGRLREILALPDCRGACIPEADWLSLTNMRYLLLDKVYDLTHEGIFYDTAFPLHVGPASPLLLDDLMPFEADRLHILYAPVDDFTGDFSGAFLAAEAGERALTPVDLAEPVMLDGLQLAVLAADEYITPAAITLETDASVVVRALTLVDSRTDDFVQLSPPGWSRIYSADIKIYENQQVMSRAFVVHEAAFFPDDWDGTESALDAMRAPDFAPGQMITINADSPPDFIAPSSAGESSAVIREYTPDRVVVEVDAAADGFLVLADAYYPGWTATDSAGESLLLLRANVMLRAVPVTAGEHVITLAYRPFWLPGIFVFGGAAWGLALLAGVLLMRRGQRRASGAQP